MFRSKMAGRGLTFALASFAAVLSDSSNAPAQLSSGTGCTDSFTYPQETWESCSFERTYVNSSGTRGIYDVWADVTVTPVTIGPWTMAGLFEVTVSGSYSFTGTGAPGVLTVATVVVDGDGEGTMFYDGECRVYVGPNSPSDSATCVLSLPDNFVKLEAKAQWP